MTAEIGVMNSTCVALAADSAVTIGGERYSKIYSTADKLFQLSENNPVGVMTFGMAAFGGIPWETIIKAYRRKLGNKNFSTVKEYAQDFLLFLTGNSEIFNEHVQRAELASLVRLVLVSLRSSYAEHLTNMEQKRVNRGKPLTQKDIRKAWDKSIDTLLVLARKHPKLESIPEGLIASLDKEISSQIRAVRRKVFNTLPFLAETHNRVKLLVKEILTHRWFEPLETGLVIAGFGRLQYTPSLVKIGIAGMVRGYPRWHIDEELEIDNANSAFVCPFAESRNVHTFMAGMSPSLGDFISESVIKAMNGLVNAFENTSKKYNPSWSSAIKAEMKSLIRPLLESLSKEWEQRSRERHWGPIVRMISFLPKDETASVAEALVNLEKLNKKMSFQEETVGGPIDVAVITKGDGFVWVKRKHYFDPEKNPRIVGRLLRGEML